MRLFDIPDDVLRITSAVAYSLDTKYYMHVFICVRGSEVEVTINNEHANHIDTCRSACMDVFELLKRNQGATSLYVTTAVVKSSKRTPTGRCMQPISG